MVECPLSIKFEPNNRLIEKQLGDGTWVPMDHNESKNLLVLKTVNKQSKHFDISQQLTYFIRTPDKLTRLQDICLVEYVGTIPEGM